MRYAKIDANHHVVVDALRKVGATVQSLAPVGKGVPDLLVGWRGQNFLMEIKDGSKAPSERKLTPDQIKWHGDWKGRVYVVNNEADAVAILCTAIFVGKVLGDDI
jgi:hypothetical protein